VFEIAIFWRWNYIFPQFKYIINLDLSMEREIHKKLILSKFDYFDDFVLKVFLAIIIDLLFAPIFIFFAPFFLICFWRIPLLVKCLKISSTSQSFCKHRFIFFRIGCLCFTDFLCLFPLALTFVTLYRIPNYFRLLNLEKGNSKTNKSHNKVSTSEIQIIVATEQNEDKPPNEDEPISLEKTIREAEKPKILEPSDPKSRSFSRILKKESYNAYLNYGKLCGILVFLEITSFPFFLFGLTHPKSVKFYLEKRKEKLKKQKSAILMERYYKIKKEICWIKFIAAFIALAGHLSTILVIILLCLLIWRLPTFILLLTKSKLNEVLFKELVPDEEKRKEVLESGSTKLIYVLIFCIIQVFWDLFVLPCFIALFVITPWKSYPVLRQMFRFDEKDKISLQISKQRGLVSNQLLEGLSDIFAVFKSILLLVTLIRIPFTVVLIIKGHYPHSKASKGFTGNYFQLNMPNKAKLSVRKCIKIAFIELLKDLPVLPFGLLLLAMAPWRIFTLKKIVTRQIDRIPTYDIEHQIKYMKSNRWKVCSQFKVVLWEEYPAFLKVVALIFSIYKIPTVFKIFWRYFRRNEESKFKLTEIIHLESIEVVRAILIFLSSIVILVCIVRIPRTIQRLKVYRKIKDEKEKAYQLQKKRDQEAKSAKTTLNDITWDTYGVISKFLTAQDLGNLSQVNKKFNTLNKKDFYWEYHYNRDYSSFRQNEDATFQQKCAAAVSSTKVYKEKLPLSHEERDFLFKSVFIFSEEAIYSIRSFPHLILIPFKLISFIIWRIFGAIVNKERFPWFGSIVGTWTYLDTHTMKSNFPANYQESKEFKTMHEGIKAWVYYFAIRYVSFMGYIFSYPIWVIIRAISAGETKKFIYTQADNLHHTFPEGQFVNRGTEAPQRIQNRLLRFICHLMQLVSIPIVIGYFAALLAVFPFLICYYGGWPWWQGIFGPGLTFIIHYAAVINILVTSAHFLDGVPYFQPYKVFSDLCEFIGFAMKKAWKHVGKPLFDALGDALKSLCKGLGKGIEYLCKGIKQMFVHGYKGVKFIIKNFVSGYGQILVQLTKMFLKCGRVGDFLLIPFALVWMLWPLIIPIFLENKIYFVPCGIVSVILIFLGYKIIKKTSKGR